MIFSSLLKSVPFYIKKSAKFSKKVYDYTEILKNFETYYKNSEKLCQGF